MVLGFLVADFLLALRLALARSYIGSSCRLQSVRNERQAHLVVVSCGGKKSQAHSLREIGFSGEKRCKIGSLTYLQNKPTSLHLVAEKSTPHCKLSEVQALVEGGRVRATASAFGGARELGINDLSGMCAVKEL